MFTGLIEEMASVRDFFSRRLIVERPAAFSDIRVGSSIAVSGVCLTVGALDDSSMTFSVVPETLAKSTLGSLRKDGRVNLERAMPATGRLDGHVVQGHSEGVGIIENGELRVENLVVRIPNDLLPFVVQKGSIAIDGVSLTVASIEGNRVSIALIPHTLAKTTLGSLKKGDRVNIETDVLIRSRHTTISPSP